MKSRGPAHWLALAACAAAGWLGAGAAAGRDLVASMGELPKLTESPDTGPFAELLKAIDDVYTGGAIVRRMFPFTRSLDNVINGRADFHVPVLRDPTVDLDTLEYGFATEPMGVVEFVLYSNVERPVTAEMVRAKLRDPAGFSLQIDGLRGTPKAVAEVPVQLINDLEISLQKVAAGRIDALLTPQEEGDHALRKLRLKSIHRAHYMSFDDMIAIPKGPAGEQIDAILTPAVRALKASGRWDSLYSTVHQPYDDWQPADRTDW